MIPGHYRIDKQAKEKKGLHFQSLIYALLRLA